MDTTYPDNTGIDLSNCDREPIHIPGKVQSHGFLVVLDRNSKITHCSTNINKFLTAGADQLLGKSVDLLEELLKTPETEPFIHRLIKAGMTIKGFAPQNPYPVYIQKQFFNLILSRSGEFYILEFEPEFSDLKQDLQQLVGSSISEMLADADLNRLLFNTARQIKKLIGYDRVMIYKFHEDGHGEVVAEEKKEDLKMFLGLHYPASDIPRQARDLYKKNLTRLISNVHENPSPILSIVDADKYPLDLTEAGLRAVSPIHIQYLKNMKVESSFSISLMDREELWGLIACHNYSPRFINYKEREAAKLIGQVLSSALSYRKNKEDESKKYSLKIKVDELVRNLVRDDTLNEALCSHQVTIKDAVDAGGAALIYDNAVHTVGKVPPRNFILTLTAWLQKNSELAVFQTDRLPKLFEEARAFKDVSSGILSCRINKELEEYVIWFRPEVLNTIHWAGNPEKAADLDASGILKISPRTSFEAWTEEVQMTSTPWKNEDIESAMNLREEITYTINRKATELRVLNEKLKAAYDELNTFSYTISHDLKNPLSSIKGFTELILSDDRMPPAEVKFMLERVLANTSKMERMIREVLNYSKAGNQPIVDKQLNMKEILEEVKQELLIGTNHPALEIIIGRSPAVNGDQMMIMQIFSNVISNAVKYSSKMDKPVIEIDGEKLEDGIQYIIKDNGIGMDTRNIYRIFDLFARLDEASDFEGSGVGLAIVKKLVNKHEGKIWVKSETGKGSAFFIMFKN